MIGARLRELRNRENLTLSELAESLGTTSMSISRYENNQRQPDYEILKSIANLFEVSIDFLLEQTDIPNFKNIDKDIISIPVYNSYYINKDNVPIGSLDIVTSLYDFVFNPDNIIAFKIRDEVYTPYFRGGDTLIIELEKNINIYSQFYLVCLSGNDNCIFLELLSRRKEYFFTRIGLDPKPIIKNVQILGRVLSLHRNL